MFSPDTVTLVDPVEITLTPRIALMISRSTESAPEILPGRDSKLNDIRNEPMTPDPA
jgi:hypothetical protein